jgi:beta-glucosidase
MVNSDSQFPLQSKTLGALLVQVYISLPANSDQLTHPLLLQLAKVRDLVPGSSKEYVQVVLDKYAVSYWNDIIDAWTVETGVYRVEVGTSSSDRLSLGAAFEVTKGFDWSGL